MIKEQTNEENTNEERMSQDYLLRVSAANGAIRGFFAITTNTVNEAFKIHRTTPVVTAAFGRMLTAAACLGAMQKNSEDIVTLTIKGDGPLRGVVVATDAQSNVRGYVLENIVDLPLKENGKLDVSGAIGDGFLTLIKDIGLKDPYSGQTPLVSGEIAEDLTYYFLKSEQTPSAVGLGVLVDVDYSVKTAGGFIVQLMPDCDEEIITTLENNIQALPVLTTLYEQGETPYDIASRLFAGLTHVVTEKTPVTYLCNCSRERVSSALVALGRAELENILEQDKKAELSCHFCNKTYSFDEQDLRKVLEQK